MAGTISKIGVKYKVTLDFGFDENNKRIRKCKTTTTEGEAKAILNEHNYKQQINQVALPKDITVTSVSEMWMTNKVLLRCAKTTSRGYANILKNHIVPYFSDKKIQKIKKSDVEKYFMWLIEKGINVNTLHKHWQVCKQIFDYAINEKLLVENPVVNVDLPSKIKPKIDFLNTEQIKMLLDVVDNDTTLKTPVYLASYYGLRRSEICGLKWDCMDFESRTITIKEARFVEGGEKFVKAPKSQHSYRVLHMSDVIYAILQEEKIRQNEQKRIYKKQYADSGYIYVNAFGEPYKPNTLSEQFSRLITKYNLPHVTLHGLRHSFCVMGIEKGVPLYKMSRALGHGSTKVTSDIYAHLVDNTHKDTIEIISDELK